MKERKTFTFDGENSADYGLYISGNSVYNAPNREIDMISIPGRNGQLAIDMGRYENITVTYPAFVFADTQEEFREKIRRIRNWLCSKTSYQRLMDEYNPESFRLGLYKSGLEVEPIFYNRCGEFEMSFDCKPQRFLFTGEEVFTLGEWGETETYSGSIVSFEGTETTAIKTLNANIVPKQSGSGDPSLSNVRPISGYDSVNVKRIGKNFLAYDRDNGSYVSGGLTYTLNDGHITVNGTSTSNYPTLIVANPLSLKAGTYTISKTVNGTVPSGAYLYIIVEKSGLPNAPSVRGGNSFTFTLTEDRDVRIVLCAETSGKTWNNVGVDFQIERGSTATAYEPYQGTSYPISLGQTVYGGTLEVMSGKLTITKAMVDLGSLAWSYDSGNQIFYTTSAISGIALPETADVIMDIKSDIYKASSWYPVSVHRSNYAITIYRTGAIWVNNFDYTTGASFKTAMSGHTFVYPLATPTEITLTPTQVKTLLGNNNILADSGDVEVEIGENPYILVNPTKFEATPIFEVEGSGTLSVGDTTLTINNEGTTIIDTEMMEAYEDDNGAIISRNDDVEGGFPTLTSGINNVEADGLTSVKVTPKWWEL